MNMLSTFTRRVQEQTAFSYRFFSPLGNSESRRSRRCCSETDHACLYVSDLGFLLAAGGRINAAHLSAFVVVAGVRVGDGRRERLVRRGDSEGAAGGKEIKAPSVVAISTSALSSPMSRRKCTTEVRRVSPPLLRRRMRRSCSSFPSAGSGVNCSPSEESDERSNEASTGSMMDRCAFRTSCWADDSVLCCLDDGCDCA